MKKIFPIDANSGKWRAYSQYIQWTNERIDGWESFLRYFNPSYSILNESTKMFDVLSHTSKDSSIITYDPAWEYDILSTNSDGEVVVDQTVYCYFPSELFFRQGYLNSHGTSYLCYFSPPFLTNEDNPPIKQTITKTEWNDKIAKGKAVIFPPSRVVFASKWRHSGTQWAHNPEGFNPNNYLLVARASSAWYTPRINNHAWEFTFVRNAAEEVGLEVPFNVELVPNRYIYIHPDKIQQEDGIMDLWKWNTNKNTEIIYATTYNSATTNNILFSLTASNTIIPWVQNYPIMHKLEVITSIKDENSKIVGWNVEDFIVDDSFEEGRQNLSSRSTSYYTIRTPFDIDEIRENSLWENVNITIC